MSHLIKLISKRKCCLTIPLYMTIFFFTGDITQKGYEKKRAKLLAPYMPARSTGKLLRLKFVS